jgi:hypothetical protein
MTELFRPRPVHDGRGSDLGNEERVSLPRCTLLSFQRPLCGGTVLATSLLELETRKRPLAEGPAYCAAGIPAVRGLLFTRLLLS